MKSTTQPNGTLILSLIDSRVQRKKVWREAFSQLETALGYSPKSANGNIIIPLRKPHDVPDYAGKLLTIREQKRLAGVVQELCDKQKGNAQFPIHATIKGEQVHISTPYNGEANNIFFAASYKWNPGSKTRSCRIASEAQYQKLQRVFQVLGELAEELAEQESITSSGDSQIFVKWGQKNAYHQGQIISDSPTDNVFTVTAVSHEYYGEDASSLGSPDPDARWRYELEVVPADAATTIKVIDEQIKQEVAAQLRQKGTTLSQIVRDKGNYISPDTPDDRPANWEDWPLIWESTGSIAVGYATWIRSQDDQIVCCDYHGADGDLWVGDRQHLHVMQRTEEVEKIISSIALLRGLPPPDEITTTATPHWPADSDNSFSP